MDYLQRISVLSGNVSNICIFCNSDVESVNHVLLLCPSIWKVWSNLVDWWGLRWVVTGSIEGLLNWWAGFKFKKFDWMVWKTIPTALLWYIWKCRNDCVFRGTQPQVEELCELVKIRIALWVKYNNPRCVFSVHDLVHCMKQIRSTAG